MNDFEAQLRRLVPLAPDLDRDRVMFEAGRAAGASSRSRWRAATGALALLSIGLAIALGLRNERPAPAPAAPVVVVPAPEPPTTVETPVPVADATPTLPLNARQWRDRLLLLDLQAGAPTSAPSAEPASGPERTTSLRDGIDSPYQGFSLFPW